MAKFAARRLSILSAWQLGRCCTPRRRLFRSQSRPGLQVLISRPVPLRSVLPRRHPSRRRRRFSQRQVLLSFLASAPMPILFIAGLLQRSSEIFGGVLAKFFLQRRNVWESSGIKSRKNCFERLVPGERIEQA